MSDCYVYYRIDEAHAGPARTALAAVLRDVAAEMAIDGRAYCKSTEPLLWMEVYRDVGDIDALTGRLAELSRAHGLDQCLADNQRRHVEHFVPLAPLP